MPLGAGIVFIPMLLLEHIFNNRYFKEHSLQKEVHHKNLVFYSFSTAPGAYREQTMLLGTLFTE